MKPATTCRALELAQSQPGSHKATRSPRRRPGWNRCRCKICTRCSREDAKNADNPKNPTAIRTHHVLALNFPFLLEKGVTAMREKNHRFEMHLELVSAREGAAGVWHMRWIGGDKVSTKLLENAVLDRLAGVLHEIDVKMQIVQGD
jgi:hypothetical protein